MRNLRCVLGIKFAPPILRPITTTKHERILSKLWIYDHRWWFSKPCWWSYIENEPLKSRTLPKDVLKRWSEKFKRSQQEIGKILPCRWRTSYFYIGKIHFFTSLHFPAPLLQDWCMSLIANVNLTWSCKRGAGNDDDHDDMMMMVIIIMRWSSYHHGHDHHDDDHVDQKVIITYDETFWSNHKISKLQHMDFDKFGKITCPSPVPPRNFAKGRPNKTCYTVYPRPKIYENRRKKFCTQNVS